MSIDTIIEISQKKCEIDINKQFDLCIYTDMGLLGGMRVYMWYSIV